MWQSCERAVDSAPTTDGEQFGVIRTNLVDAEVIGIYYPLRNRRRLSSETFREMARVASRVLAASKVTSRLSLAAFHWLVAVLLTFSKVELCHCLSMYLCLIVSVVGEPVEKRNRYRRGARPFNARRCATGNPLLLESC